jgi:hypothetical protein
MKFPARFTLSTAVVSTCLLAQIASAATIINQTYTGSYPATISASLPDQDTALELTFTLPSTENLTASTTSYATGGFQPNITLFNSSGIAIANQWATPPSSAVADPNTGLTIDSYLTANNLTAGTYVLALTDWALGQSVTATNLSDGFTSNFGNGVTFVDIDGNTRTGAYALHLDASAVSSVPEPASILLLAPIMLAAMVVRKRLAAHT